MPVEYSGIAAEHMAVRDARRPLRRQPHGRDRDRRQGRARRRPAHLVQRRLEARRSARRSTPALLTPAGHVRRRPAGLPPRREHFLLVVNASNIVKDYAWIAEQIAGVGDAVAVERQLALRALALQGPAARGVLQPLTGVDLGVDQVLLVRARRSRQRPRHDLAHRLHRRGRLRDLRAAAVGRARLARDPRGRASPPGVVPAGLGARDTLRLEAAMRLYGNDIDDTTTVLEADLGWIVGWKKADFIGADALRRQKAGGRDAQARRLRDARPRHRPPRLRRLRRRRRRPAS